MIYWCLLLADVVVVVASAGQFVDGWTSDLLSSWPQQFYLLSAAQLLWHEVHLAWAAEAAPEVASDSNSGEAFASPAPDAGADWFLPVA